MANYIGNFKDKNNNILVDDDIIKSSSCGTLWNNSVIDFNDGDTTWVTHDVVFNGEWSWNGNGYLIDDGNGKSISIGDNVSLVKVSGWVAISYADRNNSLELHIKKNDNYTGIVAFTVKAQGYGTITLSIPPTQLYVSKGDKISLSVSNAAGGKITLYSDAGRPVTALQVEVIK